LFCASGAPSLQIAGGRPTPPLWNPSMRGFGGVIRKVGGSANRFNILPPSLHRMPARPPLGGMTSLRPEARHLPVSATHVFRYPHVGRRCSCPCRFSHAGFATFTPDMSLTCPACGSRRSARRDISCTNTSSVTNNPAISHMPSPYSHHSAMLNRPPLRPIPRCCSQHRFEAHPMVVNSHPPAVGDSPG
jgi:hypothetical protein